MSTERGFASLQIVTGTDNVKRFFAVANDGTAWLSDVTWLIKPEGGPLKRMQAEEWHQIKPLPGK